MGDITYLLHQWREGDREAEQELFALAMPVLRRRAQYLMKGERRKHTFEWGDLANQVYIELVAAKDHDWQNRDRFFAFAYTVMYRDLIDHVRGRPNAEFVAIEGMEEILPAGSIQIHRRLTGDKVLNDLADFKPEWRELVEMKWVLRLTDKEAAARLGLKLRTMQREWSKARRWLFKHTQKARKE